MLQERSTGVTAPASVKPLISSCSCSRWSTPGARHRLGNGRQDGTAHRRFRFARFISYPASRRLLPGRTADGARDVSPCTDNVLRTTSFVGGGQENGKRRGSPSFRGARDHGAGLCGNTSWTHARSVILARLSRPECSQADAGAAARLAAPAAATACCSLSHGGEPALWLPRQAPREESGSPDWASELEPVSGFEPLTCRLQGGRSAC